MSILKKLRGDPPEEKKVNHSDAHLPSDSREKAELPEAGLYSVKETARRLGIHRDTLYRWITEDSCPIVPLRLNKGAIRFSRARVEQFVAGNTG